MKNYKSYVDGFYLSMLLEGDVKSANELLCAYTFGRELESGLYILGNPDLEDQRAKERYGRVIKRINDAEPKEYFDSDFESLDQKDVFECALSVLEAIFGPSKEMIDSFNEFKRYMDITNSNMILDGCSYKMMDETGIIKHQVLIPSVTNTSSVVCILHEFAHYYFQKNNIIYKKHYYTEILSILFEKIAADIMADKSGDSKFIKKIESTRLEGIRYHYITKKDELKQLVRAMNNAEVERENASKLAKDYTDYSESVALSYGLGYIYAESLYNLYKEDEKAFQQKMREIFGMQTTLQSTLDYYDVNLSNKKVYEQVSDKIRNMTK